MQSFAALLFALLLVVVSAGACNSSTVALAPDDGCTLNSECAPGLVCAFGRCSAACRTAADCMGGACVFDATMHTVCQYPESQLCEKQGDCTPPLACASDYRCRNICDVDADCNVLGINGRVCARDANGVRYCAVPPEVSDGEIVALPPLNYLPIDGGPAPPDGAIAGPLEASVSLDAGDATLGSSSEPDAPTGIVPDGASLDASSSSEPFGFSPTNFNLTLLVDGGAEAGSADVTISANCTNCLGPATTTKLSDGTPVDLYVLNSLEIDPTAGLTLTGPRPIVLAILTTATIDGQISVAASGGTPGPGGFAPSNAGPGAGAVGFTGAYTGSNGGGGSYCGAGGKGGATTGPGAPGGPTYGTATLQSLVGGSAGGAGPYGDPGGAGGGAIEIVAGTSIEVGPVGSINAGGGGVAASAGGSGGAILLEAPAVVIAGAVAANGAGGSYGSGFSPAGSNGAPSGTPAAGVVTGGNGSAATAIAGSDGQVDDSGASPGAGGGGAGWIRIDTPTGTATITGTVSPSLTTPCATQGKLQ